MANRLPDIHLDNDYEVEKAITQRNTSTGDEEPATGLSGLLCWISATDKGPTIHADLSKTTTERGALALYAAVIDGDDLTTHLEDDYADEETDVFVVFGDGVNIRTSDPVRVIGKRRSR